MDEITDKIWDALDRGEASIALELLETLTEREVEHWIAESVAWSDLGDLSRARDSLDAAGRQLSDPLDLDFLWAEAELRLREWRIDDASDVFESLEAIDRNAAVLERQSFCAELDGDFDGADRLLTEANKLDPKGYPLPPRISSEDMDRLLDQAVERLSEDFRGSLESVEIRVAPVPTLELTGAFPDETPPDALGLFIGSSALESAGADTPELPPVIYVFQRNLERFAADEAELRQEIEVTLYHEIGHLLGFDEEGVEAMGLE